MSKKTRTLSITSGKGGVGKTTLVSNLALALASAGRRVLILDGDLGMANIEIFFGARPAGDLSDVLEGRKSVSDILTPLTPQIDLISGGTGFSDLQSMNNFQRRFLLEAVGELPATYDWMLIDTPPGLNENVLSLNAAAQAILVIITPDPASFADAYALMKVLHQKMKENRFQVVCNQVKDSQEGLSLFHRFQDVTSRFLDVSLDYVGPVPHDVSLRRANQQQRLILRQDPQSLSGTAISAIASRLAGLPERAEIKGGLQIFWNQVVGVA